MKYIFDLIVIGGGHAGVEAALVAKRSGLNVALITLDKTKTGRMSCNPAIGGIGSHCAILWWYELCADGANTKTPESIVGEGGEHVREDWLPGRAHGC